MAKPLATYVKLDGEIAIPLANGALTVPVTDILSMPAEVRPRGLAVADVRGEYAVFAKDEHDKDVLVPIVVSVYIQRGPVTDDEARAVKAALTDRDAKTKTRKEEAAKTLQEARFEGARFAHMLVAGKV